MGIQGLLPFLKKIHEPINVSHFSGCTVAIDAYCWLHKGAFSCAEKLALGEKTDQYVYYCMKFINYLLSKNIKPIMVFDGCHLPSKKNVEKTRREKREMNRKKAAQFLREGRRAEARECLQRCIDISPEMALELMNVCRDKGVDCIVAPYEADAQLAYLNKCGIAQVVITEDSDLLLFGCDRVIFKMDHAGNGVLIEQKRLNEVMNIQSAHFTFEKFRYMCILSGCDYLASLPGIGLAKANKVFKIARQADLKQLLKKLSTYLKTSITVPQEYIDGFIAADNTFLYQLTYDPLRRKLVPLNPYPPDINKAELNYAGEYMPQQKALDVALGNINIYTGEKFAGFDPDTFMPKYGSKKKPEMLHMLSMWDKNYRIRPRGALHERQEPERPNLKGKEVVVKAHVRKSPHKRVREAEESKDAMSNTELSSLYSDKSPVKKKARREDVDNHLQRFLFADEQDDQGNQSEEEEEDPPQVQPGPSRSPRFFNSLSSAHPKVKVEESEGVDTDKENHKSPRNKFACKSPSKKPRFSLNSVLPDVKSRFFASSTKQDVTKLPVVSNKPKSPEKTHKTRDDLNGFKPVHKNTLNIYTKAEPDKSDTEEDGEETGEDTEDIIDMGEEKVKPFSFSKLGKTESEKSSPSPTSAFSWSKFKFTRHNSTDQVSQLEGNKNVKSQFKKVVSESNLEKFLKKQPDKKLEEKKHEEMSYEEFLNRECQSGSESNKDEGLVSSLESDQTTEEDSGIFPSSSTSMSVDSYPYSIDSACISQSDLCKDSQKSTSDSQLLSPDSQTKTSGMKGYQILKVRESIPIGYDEKIVLSSTPNSDFSKEDISDISHTKPTSLSESTEDKPLVTGKNVFKSNSIYFQSKSDRSNKHHKEDEHEPHEIVDLLDSDDDTEINNGKLSRSTPKSFVSPPNTTSKNTVKSGCRVSGLRKGPKKQNKPVVNDTKQQNLKDMFAKFAHKKGDQPKLMHTTDHMNTTEDDNYTPESSKSVLGMKSGVQKRML